MAKKIAPGFTVDSKTSIKDSQAGAQPLSSGDKQADRAEVGRLAEAIGLQQQMLYASRTHKVLVILQGMDTSGKDGTVNDVFAGVNPQGIRIANFKAPSAIELQHDYLWRIHQQVPVAGEIAVFNRSHYEDVLITRVHGWIDERQCKQRYAQINDFERMLSQTGTVILKFFLHISKAEQKSRLQARIDDPGKHWKFEMGDIEERKFWDDYQRAYQNALRATSTDHAPWIQVPADSKTHRNLVVANVVLETLQGLKLKFPDPKPELKKLKFD
ncbi:polyphosphate kinase 2 family protein [Herbaspirillum sp. YR522]|uniref:polyphosphate kinase 2 family protein n=1 Tax=Herbaspirillum sp. YR522 TaxID=1144342 RepID=UPI00026FA21F|nr:polyphosphate kinase 2 family protein [Herbaspirillum sp. YR522]EJN09762.1 polyphosphate:nucleotide phosphotransferase, PPK2 family [Herbaspirillum sp. YR522]